MDALYARWGIWTARFAPHLTVLRGLLLAVGYANLHLTTVASAATVVRQVALR